MLKARKVYYIENNKNIWIATCDSEKAAELLIDQLEELELYGTKYYYHDPTRSPNEIAFVAFTSGGLIFSVIWFIMMLFSQ